MSNQTSSLGAISPTTGTMSMGAGSDTNLRNIIDTTDPHRLSDASLGLQSRTSTASSGKRPRITFAQRDVHFNWHAVRADNVRPDAVLTSKGLGLTLLDGELRSWDAVQGGWKVVTPGVDGMCLGADGHTVYLRNDQGQVTMLDADGTLPDTPTTVFALPAETLDFAVLPDNRIAMCLAPGADDGQRTLRACSRDGQECEIPIPAHVAKLKGVTVSNSGDVMVLDVANVVHVLTADAGGEPVFNALPMVRPGETVRPRVDRLRTLADGSIAAIDHDTKGLVRLAEEGGWQATDLNAPTPVEQFYSRLKGPMAVNLFGVAGFPWAAQNHQEGKPWWKPAMFHKAREGQSLPVRWAKWMLAHQPFKNSGTETLHDVKAMRKEIKADFDNLASSLEYRKNSVNFTRDVMSCSAPVSGAAAKVLDQIERAVDLVDDKGTVKENYLAPEKYRAYILAESESYNTLKVVLSFRRQCMGLGDDDPVNARLQRLIDHGVTLNAHGGNHRGGKNDLGVLTGKLLHDHAALLGIHRALAPTAEGVAIPTPDEAREQVKQQVEDGGLNELFKSGVHDIRTAHKTNRAVSKLTGSLSARYGKLRHAARAGGMLTGDIAQQYVRFVENLKPGQSITLRASTGSGSDGDGQAHVFQGSDSSKNHIGPTFDKPWFNPNIAPSIQVLLTAAKRQEYQVQITKTDDGIKLQIGEASTLAARAGVKLSWAVGAAGQFKAEEAGPQLTGVAVAAVEAIPELGGTRSKGNAVSLEIKNDGKGNVQRVVKDLFHGRASLESLAIAAGDLTPTRGQSSSLTAQMPMHGLAAALLEGSIKTDDPPQQLRLVLAPVLSQVSLGAEAKGGKTVTGRGEKGGEVNLLDRVDMVAQAKHISIFEAQHQGTQPAPPTDNLGGPPLPNGYAKQDKEPLMIFVLEKTLWSKHLHNDASIRFKDDGSLESVSVQVGPKSKIKQRGMGRIVDLVKPMKADVLTPQNLPQLPALLQAQPALQPYIDRLVEQGIQPSVHLELRPEVMAELVPGSPGFEEAVKEAITHPANLRIASIDVRAGTGYTTGASFGRSLLRYSSTASNDFSTPAGRIEISYPDGDPPQLKASGALVLGHRAVPNFKAFEVVQQAGGGGDLLAAVLQPVRSPATRFLVGQTVEHRQWTDADLRRGASRLMVNQAGAAGALGRTGNRHHAPIQNGSLGLVNGEMVYRQAGGALARVSHDLASHVLLHLGPNLLPLMAAGTSGMLEVPRAVLDDIGPRLEDLTWMPTEPTPRPSTSFVLRPAQRRLHIADILQHLRDNAETMHVRDLNPAERLIVAAFFPTHEEEQPIDLQRLGDTMAHHTLYNAFLQEIDGSTPATRPVHVAPTVPYGTPSPTEGSEASLDLFKRRRGGLEDSEESRTSASSDPLAAVIWEEDETESDEPPQAPQQPPQQQQRQALRPPVDDDDEIGIDPRDLHLLTVPTVTIGEGSTRTGTAAAEAPGDFPYRDIEVVPDTDQEREQIRQAQQAQKESKWFSFFKKK